MDIDRQILICELEGEFLQVMEEKAKEKPAPDWFLIGNGLKEADERTKFKAVEILKSFIRFSRGISTPGNEKTFEQLVELFTLSQARNNALGKVTG